MSRLEIKEAIKLGLYQMGKQTAIELYDKGATYVLMPHFLGGSHTSTLIERYGLDLNKFLKEKTMHIEHLRNRKEIGHEHFKHGKHN